MAHFGLAAGALGLWALWLAWLWQPERQLRLHHEHLLKAVARRNWNSVSGFLADDYSDPWGGSKTETPGEGAEAFRSFFSLSVQERGREMTREGRVTEHLHFTGGGTPLAEMVLDRGNSLAEPFVFTWVHRSSHPWDWQLRRVEQPELRLDSAGGF